MAGALGVYARAEEDSDSNDGSRIRAAGFATGGYRPGLACLTSFSGTLDSQASRCLPFTSCGGVDPVT